MNILNTAVENSPSQLLRYEKWLGLQDFSGHTKRGYLSQIRQFLAFASKSSNHFYDLVIDPSGADDLVQEYSTYLRDSVKSSLSSINTTLTAIDSYYRFLGLGSSTVKRERTICKAPRVLSIEENMRLADVIANRTSAKERAVLLLFLSSGIRLAECSALNIEDLVLGETNSKILVRTEKGRGSRSVPVDESARRALLDWVIERNKRPVDTTTSALFTNYSGQRMSTQGLDLIVRKIGIRAGLVLSAQVLRDTFLTDLASKTNDAFVVAKISGHMRLDSTRKYFEVASNRAAY
jgi:site-specific recombinase XerD